LLFTVIGNTEFKSSNTNALKGQLSISLYNNADKVHFTGTYDTQTELMTFNLDTRANVTVDNKMVFTNGISQLTAPAVDLSTAVTIYLYTEDGTIVDNTNYLVNELVVPTTKPTVLDKETIDVEFGKAIDTIWNKEYTTYTDRQYKKHTADKNLVYKHDVYARDPATGSIITVKTIAGVKTATKTLLHAAGSSVLDANGVPVLEYKAGDIVLDTNGVPITDNIYGAIQHVDILMLEYKYLVASGVVATNYRTSIKDTVDGWLFNSLVGLNKKVLENTKVLYRSYKKSMPIDVIINSAVTKIPYTAKPQVDIYSATNTYTGAQLSNMSTSIGYIIHKHLDMPVINFADIKQEIISTVDTTIVTVKISGIEPTNSTEIIVIKDPMRRLTLDKKLVINDANELVVEYNIDLRLHKI